MTKYKLIRPILVSSGEIKNIPLEPKLIGDKLTEWLDNITKDNEYITIKYMNPLSLQNTTIKDFLKENIIQVLLSKNIIAKVGK